MTILIVDAMPVVYQAFATVGHFSTKQGESTGTRYGFLRSVRSWSERFKARKTVICWDTPEPILKAAGVSTYKSDRVQTPEKLNMFQQIPGVKEMMALTYLTQVQCPGHEADDLCGTVARFYEEKYGEDSVIATVDRDSFSAVTDKVSVFHTTKDKRIITPSEVIAHYGVRPNLVPALKAVLGDPSDNIEPLIKGARADQFRDFLVNMTDLSDSENAIKVFFNTNDDDADGTLVDALLNLRLTTLHHVPMDSWQITKGSRDAVALTALFERLEFASMMKYVDQLTQTPNWPAEVLKPKRVKKEK